GFPAPKFYELDTSAHTVKQSGFFFSTATSDDFNVSIVATAAGDAFVSWTATDTPNNVLSQARFSGRQSGDTAGTMEASVLLAASAAARNTGTTPEPWGRYSGIAIDPTAVATCAAGKRAYVANELAPTATKWSTSFGRIGLC